LQIERAAFEIVAQNEIDDAADGVRALNGAPPLITSMDSIAAAGIVLTSTTSAAFAGCARRPFTSTRLRFGPRPRRLRTEMPGVFVAVDCTSVVPNCVPAPGPPPATPGTNWGSAVSTPTVLRRSNCSSPKVSMGRRRVVASRDPRTGHDDLV
jgi:hypothetical protein